MELEEHMLLVFLANILLGAHSLHLPPTISSVFQSEYFLNDSCYLSLRCQGLGDVTSYVWYQNGSQIKENTEIVANKITGELLISKNCTYQLLGLFYCIAENKYGSTLSPFVKISEPVLNSFDLTHHPDIVVCTANEHCQLKCTGKPNCEPHAACDLAWYQGSGTQNSISSSESTAIDLEGNLHFLNVSEVSGNKTYACGIWNKRMNTLRQANLMTLNINDSTAAPLLRAIYHSRSKALLGKSAALECIFSGIFVPEIKWKNPKGSYITTNDKYRIGPYGRQLQIMNVTYNDEGNYYCNANNLTQTPSLNVTSPPIFPENNSSFLTKTINIFTYDAVNLNCNAVSLPTENAPVKRWMKNGILIGSFQDFKIQLLDNNSVLRIFRAHFEKGGAFQCVAENSEGIAVANFLIEPENVKGKSTTIGPKQGKKHQLYGKVNKQMIIMISSVVVSLMTLVTLCVIIRKRIYQRNKSWKAETEVNTNIYTLPSEEFDEHHRRSDEEIHLEEMYSTVEEARFNHMTQCIEGHVGDNNTKAEDLGEYDVLRGKRQNEEASQSENIYDRTNNVVSGIYDSPSTQSAVNVYTI